MNRILRTIFEWVLVAATDTLICSFTSNWGEYFVIAILIGFSEVFIIEMLWDEYLKE